MRITLVQTNTTVGDIQGNVARIVGQLVAASIAGPDLVVFPEMCIAGYPPLDLLERPGFVDAAHAGLAAVCDASRQHPDMGIVVGLPMRSDRESGKGVANVAVLVHNGSVVHAQEKSLLPTYDVFDEARYFDAAQRVTPIAFKGEMIGLSICEDAWNDPTLFVHRRYATDPIADLATAGATLLVNISASPYSLGKDAMRAELVRRHAGRHHIPMVMVNQVGGNDELIFDGASVVADAEGALRVAMPVFSESVTTVDLSHPPEVITYPSRATEAVLRQALVLGIRDYLGKCGFAAAVVGVSGGIDSAVTLALAVEAIGAGNVTAVAMPSPHSSPESLSDARELAESLKVRLEVIPIVDVMHAFDHALASAFSGRSRDVTEENLQARIRGNILMAMSNKMGSIVLSTGNKSELAMGYCTLYGDMSGGLAAISDVPKTMVYRLAQSINSEATVIPNAILAKAPSAELRPGQKDTDSLPPYDVLDPILDLYIENGATAAEIVAAGFDESVVRSVLNTVRRSEYKRKQAAPGLKVTSKAFGIGRRFPVASRYDA